VGQSYEVDTRTVWDVALRASQVYFGALQVMSELLQTPSGITLIMGDTYDIDGEQLRLFVLDAARYLSVTNHPVWQLFGPGIVTICLALHYRVCGEWLTEPPITAEMLAQASRFETRMAT
jgi:Family of unknown function (DUF6086)